MFLNCVLLFIVVFYAYPMKFLFTRLVTGTLLGIGPGIDEGMSSANGRLLMAVYSGGFVALFATVMLLHWNALRQRRHARVGYSGDLRRSREREASRDQRDTGLGVDWHCHAAADRLPAVLRPDLLFDGPGARRLRLPERPQSGETREVAEKRRTDRRSVSSYQLPVQRRRALST